MIIVIGIDQSLRATGITTLRAEPGQTFIERARAVITVPDKKSKHLYKADDDGMRVDEIARALIEEIKCAKAGLATHVFVACEAPAGAQSATAAKALGLAYGVVRGVCAVHGMTPVVIQAHHAKKALTGSASASKKEMVDAAREFWGSWGKQTKPANEAIADAGAVALCALREPTLQAMWGGR
jgi:Holliday junction resolvasome RuvABC endonuclease subunit